MTEPQPSDSVRSIVVILILVLAPISHQVPFVKGINQSSYESGYIHGVQDAKTIYGLSNFMTNQGFGNHTSAFNQGFIDGYCSIAGKGAGSDADQGTFECEYDATQFKGINEQNPFQHGYMTGQNDSKTNLYDSANACNDYNTINNTAAQAFECLKGYADGNISPYHSGYLQGIQGVVLQKKDAHTSEFIKGYFKGLQGYYWNRGLVEGYSGLPLLQKIQKNKNYTDAYKSEAVEVNNTAIFY